MEGLEELEQKDHLECLCLAGPGAVAVAREHCQSEGVQYEGCDGAGGCLEFDWYVLAAVQLCELVEGYLEEFLA